MANTLKLGAGKWATGTDTVLAFNDENNNFKPLPFSFSRASSATVVNQSGLIETVGSGTPRIDFLGNTKGALKLEPQRTNLIPYSESINNWIQERITTTVNSIISPQGNMSADKINIDSTANSTHQAYIGPLTNTVGNVCISGFFKKGEYEWVHIGSGNANSKAFFNLKNGTVGEKLQDVVSSNIIDYGNGWYRCISVVNSSTTSNYWEFGMAVEDGNRIISGTPESGGLYAWGIQLEDNSSYPTSYIPTQGSAVTRVADVCNQTVPDGVIGQTEGTMFAEFEIGEDNSHFFLYTNTSNAIYIQTKIGDVWRAYVINGGVYQVAITTGSVPSSGFVKMAFAYKENDFVLYANGNLIGADTSGSVPTCDTYDLGLGPYGTGYSPKRTKETTLYNTRLSNAELQALTTI